MEREEVCRELFHLADKDRDGVVWRCVLGPQYNAAVFIILNCAVIKVVDSEPDWIRIQWGVWIRIPNLDPGSGYRGKEKNKIKKKFKPLERILIHFLSLTFLLQLIPTQYTHLFFSSAAEPHHFYAALTLVRILLPTL
jgi:hypothetical protein